MRLALRTTLALALTLAVSLLGAATPAHAAQLRHLWTGRVTHVADGDTFDVDIDGDRSSKVFRVRMTGIQTMEAGQCHSIAAEKSLRRLIEGKVVRLAAVDADSRATRDRLLRYVTVRRDGRWVDVNREQIRRGHALWHDTPTETTKLARYFLDAVRAADSGQRLWDDERCAAGPQAEAIIRMWVQWDAPGNDLLNVNGEWVKIQNLGITALDLSGWWLRDYTLKRYPFPAGTTVAPGETLTVHVGVGSNTTVRRYLGRSTALFLNPDASAGAIGDAIYLFDPDGDMRAHFTYPCVLHCPDPFQGAVDIGQVMYDPEGNESDRPNDEWLEIVNRSAVPADLYGSLLTIGGDTYVFGANDVLGPYQVMRLRMGKGGDSGLTRYWGNEAAILRNSGETVELRTFDLIRIDCRSWGSGSC
ncbi:MAG: lamin tail domain-containing protein [Euzebyaceae bacterium]|jgi:endonuclease YncB( thermonuclease family)|nr:lamin tail domain-containing protein [Euzebyaceae bacterium]